MARDWTRPTSWLVSDRAGFETLWAPPCSRAGFIARTVAPTDASKRASSGCAVVVDATSLAFDEDELLAVVACARASGAAVAVDVGKRVDSPWLREVLEDVCEGRLVTSPDQVPATAGRLARALDPGRAARFEFLTVSPRGTGLLALLGDGRAVEVSRPIGPGDDPGREVSQIRLSPDAETAEVVLTDDRVLPLRARDLRPADAPPASRPNGLAPVEGIGGRLRTLRIAAGLTQAELARRTGIHRPNIARVEAGRHTPSLETLGRIARAIGVSPADVVDPR